MVNHRGPGGNRRQAGAGLPGREQAHGWLGPSPRAPDAECPDTETQARPNVQVARTLPRPPMLGSMAFVSAGRAATPPHPGPLPKHGVRGRISALGEDGVVCGLCGSRQARFISHSPSPTRNRTPVTRPSTSRLKGKWPSVKGMSNSVDQTEPPTPRDFEPPNVGCRDLIAKHRGPANQSPIVFRDLPIDPWPGGPLPDEYDLLIYVRMATARSRWSTCPRSSRGTC